MFDIINQMLISEKKFRESELERLVCIKNIGLYKKQFERT